MLVDLVIFFHGCCGVWPSRALFIHTCFMKGNCKDRTKQKWESIRVWSRVFLGPSAQLRRRNLKIAHLLWKRFKSYPSTVRPENLNTQQSISGTLGHTAVSAKVVQQNRMRQCREVFWVRRIMVLDWGFRCFIDVEGNSSSKWIYGLSFLVG